MHVLFVHQNFPAQFGHIARHLIRTRGWTCTFVSKTPGGEVDGIEKSRTRPRGGARETTHYCSRTFENAVWHAHGVFEACKAHPDLRPDLIVGHSGFGSTVFLPELYPTSRSSTTSSFTIIRTSRTWTFAPSFRRPSSTSCAPGRGTPCSCSTWRPAAAATARRTSSSSSSRRSTGPRSTSSSTGSRPISSSAARASPRRIGDRSIPASTRVVTYVSRGFEAMRGFDIFMRVARAIYRAVSRRGLRRRGQRPDLLRRRREAHRAQDVPRARDGPVGIRPEQVHLHGAAAGFEAGGCSGA